MSLLPSPIQAASFSQPLCKPMSGQRGRYPAESEGPEVVSLSMGQCCGISARPSLPIRIMLLQLSSELASSSSKSIESDCGGKERMRTGRRQIKKNKNKKEQLWAAKSVDVSSTQHQLTSSWRRLLGNKHRARAGGSSVTTNIQHRCDFQDGKKKLKCRL